MQVLDRIAMTVFFLQFNPIDFGFFQPVSLEIKNESFMHKSSTGSETHFRVLIVSENFNDLNSLEVSATRFNYVSIRSYYILLIGN